MTEPKPVAGSGVNDSLSLDQRDPPPPQDPSSAPALASIYPSTCVTEKSLCLLRDEHVASPTLAGPSQPDSCFSKDRHVPSRPWRRCRESVRRFRCQGQSES